MADNSVSADPVKGKKTKAGMNGIMQMIVLNVTPVIVGFLCKKFPLLNEATWFEIVAFMFASFATFQVWFTWQNIVASTVNLITQLGWGAAQIRDAFKKAFSPTAPAILLVASGLLVSCSTIESILAPNPNVVATMESSLAVADTAALAYVQLPKCGSSIAAASKTPNICSSSSIVANIDVARKTAYMAVKAAEANETADTVQSAQNALNAFQAITQAVQ